MSLLLSCACKTMEVHLFLSMSYISEKVVDSFCFSEKVVDSCFTAFPERGLKASLGEA